MSEKSYKINDRRGQSMGFVSGNTLFEGASQNMDRVQRPRVDRDVHQNLSTYGYREMQSASRMICANFPPVAGAIDQMAMYAVGNGFNAQWETSDKKWNRKAEELIYEWDKIGNMKGPNFHLQASLRLGLRTMIRDGDANILLTGTNPGQPDDYPKYQCIPAHRIGSRMWGGMQQVVGGAYDGLTVYNGAIQDDYGIPVAWRVFPSAIYGDVWDDISADDLHLFFDPQFYEDCRGTTWLRSCINDVQDIKDIRDWLKLVIKGESSVMLQEFNETGAPSNKVRSSLLGPVDTTQPESAANPPVERIDGGTIRYFKMNKGKLESLNSTRPSTNAMEFQREILRGAFEGLGWPIEFYNPEFVGGAPARQRIAQAIIRIEMLQAIAERMASKIHGYAICKMINLGLIAPNPEWWKMRHQRPKSITVDNGYDIKAKLELYKMGFMTQRDICAELGEYWEDVQDQKIAEERRWQEGCIEASTGGVVVESENVRILYPNIPAEPEPEPTPEPETKKKP